MSPGAPQPRSPAAPAKRLRPTHALQRFLASPVNEYQTSRTQASPASRRDSLRPLLSPVGGTLPPQYLRRHHRVEEPSVSSTYRGATRRGDASTTMARVAFVRARASSRRSLGSGRCHFDTSLARSIVESPSLFGVSASYPVCRRYLPTSSHAVLMNPNQPETPTMRCSTVRHGTCFRRRLSTRHAGAAPHSAVAELGVVALLRAKTHDDQDSPFTNHRHSCSGRWRSSRLVCVASRRVVGHCSTWSYLPRLSVHPLFVRLRSRSSARRSHSFCVRGLPQRPSSRGRLVAHSICRRSDYLVRTTCMGRRPR